MTASRLPRRKLLLTGGAAALPLRAARAAMPFTVVLESEAVILDPHMTTAAITRTFGYHVFDTLFSMDSKGAIRPQMVGEYGTSGDGLTWSFALRDGLRWHDGTDVTAADCVASLQRWGKLDSLGRMLLAASASIAAEDARRFTIALKEPFPLMLDVLGKPNAPVPFMMPARIIQAAGAGRIAEITGSGPFVFRPDRWRPGDSMVLARNDAYVPRQEPADFLSGGKVVHVPEAVLRVMPDQATGASALMAGEIDYMQFLPFDLLGRLAKADGVALMEFGGLDMYQGNFRLNHASGPFADPAVRRVLWNLVSQDDILTAIGVPDRFRLKSCPSYFMCGTPLETAAGAEAAGLSVAKAKEALARTAYKGEPVVMLEVSGSISQIAGNILAQNMKQAGFAVEEQAMDWGTVLSRRAKREGWSLFPVYSNGADMASPLTHFYVTNNCADYPGWSCDTATTTLLRQFVAAAGLAERQAVAAKIQEAAYESVPSVMWGQFAIPAGHRTRVQGIVPSAFPMLWNLRVTA